MSGSGTTYRFGPLERRGLLGPLSARQAVPVAAGAVAAVIVLDHAPTPAGVIAALLLLVVAVAAATLPVAGDTPAGWVPVAGRWWLRRVRGQHRGLATTPRRGWRTGAAERPELELPPALRGVELLEIPHGDRLVGALSDGAGRWLTAVLACRVTSFELLDRETQEQRLAAWGGLLGATAATPIRRLQWIERTAPATGDELAGWLHAARDPGVPPRGVPIVDSYLELIGSSSRVMQDHEILLALQLDATRLRGGASESRAALLEHALRVGRMLEQAEIRVLGALSPRQLARALRTAFDPFARSELAALDAVTPGRPDAALQAGPVATAEGWDCFRADGAMHATFWIAGWPRVDVSPMFMNALLAPSGPVRTVSVTFEPIPPERSTREIEAAITRDQADRELRRRFGQSETARHRLAAEAAARREAELAAGHCEMRFAGFITVSGRDREDLEAACADTLQGAARARLELRRLYGQQRDAFAFTLPLARGLR